MNDLSQKLEQVKDRESFFDFVRALIEDRKEEVIQERQIPGSPYGPGANGWENITIESFLEAALSWAEATQMGQTQGLAAEPSWRGFAVFLYSGKIYK